MSLCLFKYADGRREFREIDAERHVVYRLFDLPKPTRMSWSAFSGMPDIRVPVRNFRRTEYRWEPDFHGPLESPGWCFVAGAPSNLGLRLLRHRREYMYIEVV